MKLDDALKEAARLGFIVEPMRRHGETKVYFRGQPVIRLNNRKKDAPEVLERALRRARIG